MAQGMLFNTPRTPDEEERDLRTQALEYARLTPEQQIGYDSVRGNQTMARGIQQLGGAALGVDTRSAGEQRREHEQMAQREIAALEIDPNDIDKYYPAVIAILRKHGLTDAMNAVVEKFREFKLKSEDQKIKREESARKGAADKLKAEAAMKKIEVDRAKVDRMGARALQLIGAINAAQAQMAALPEDDERRLVISSRVKDLQDALAAELATKRFLLKDAGDRLVILDQQTGEVKEGPEKGQNPDKKAKNEGKDERLSAAAVSDANRLITAVDIAVRDLNRVTTGPAGKVLSHVPGTDAYMVDKRLETVKANIGFAELNAMRKASPTGGALGQVTERELAFLQSVQGSLDIGLPTPELKSTLKRIRDSAEKVVTDNGGTAPAAPAALTTDAKKNVVTVPAKPKTEAPAPAAAKPAASGKRVTVYKDGKPFNVPAEQVQRALSSGYTEKP